MNFLAGISGDNNNPMRWSECWIGEGLTIERFLGFIDRILDDLEERYPGWSFCFTMDNLNAHQNGQVLALIAHHGHRVCFRAPYYPIDGPIEFVFNTLEARLRAKLYMIVCGATLILALNQSIQGIDDFSPYFDNVGFTIP